MSTRHRRPASLRGESRGPRTKFVESIFRVLRRSAAALALMLMVASSAAAQGSATDLQVGVFPVAPFVMRENGALSGFSVDLWNAVAARLQLKSTYQVFPDSTAMTEAMRSKKIDVMALPVYVTSARDDEFDFSYPVLDAGLGILVRDTGDSAKPASPLREMVDLLLAPAILVWLGVALLLILIPAHVVWLLDRQSKGGITESPRYIPGIFDAMFWAVTALVSQVQGLPRNWFARLLALVWMFAGVVFVAFYTAQLTATLTVQKIQGAIEGPGDLPGKQVATIAGSTAADYLRKHNAQVIEFTLPEQMFQALLDKKVDAVVFNAPVLLYYAAHKGSGLAKTVGAQFNTAPVAMLLQLNSPLRRRVNSALIALRENGTYQQLYGRWFGSN